MRPRTYIYKIAEPSVYRIVSRLDGHKCAEFTAAGLLEIRSWVDAHCDMLKHQAADELAQEVNFTEEERERQHESDNAWDELTEGLD